MSAAGRLTLAELLDLITVERLELGPDDVLVLKCPYALALADVDTLKDQVREHIPDTPVIVIDGATDIATVRKRT